MPSPGLAGGGWRGGLEQAVACRQHFHRLATGVIIVFRGEEAEVPQVHVRETAAQQDRAAAVNNHVLIHPALLHSPAARAPQPHQAQRVTAAMPDPASHEDMLAIDLSTADIGWQIGQASRDFIREVSFDHFVGVQPHRPVGGDVAMIERPLQLRRMADEGVLDHARTERLRQCNSRIAGEAVDN